MNLTRRQMLHGACGCLAAAATGCVSTESSRPLPDSNYTPTSQSLEGGLWRMFEDIEEEVRYSPARVTEPKLNTYLTGLACDLAGDHCRNLRVYVMETPHFNATMAPNGMMQIWTGLLLRCRNEAELAAVIGHEIGHYTRRHSLQRYELLSNQASIAAFFGVALAGVGGGAFASLPTLIAVANFLAYSREQEREADSIGLELMSKAGYAPIAASQIWRGLVQEVDAGLDSDEKEDRRQREAVWTATHPTKDERIAALERQARLMGITSGGDFRTESYLAAVRPHRDEMMEAELSLHQYDRTLVLIDRLAAAYPDDASVSYYRGEVNRRRNAAGDDLRASNAYGAALEKDPEHARSWRGLGLVHRRGGRHEKARDAFRNYLRLDPAASDHLMIQSYLGA
ncbi:MAG: M48 family metalloprotease [Minwuia sp.]|uniref:M48 family metalloprotease n=1 Tax=Minwuia sp. TaxID=2493630 RepID=UPI003A836AD1